METETEFWKPEVGGKAWYFDPNEKQVIRCGMVSFQSEINADHYFLNGSLARHYTLLFPTAEAALASIRVYDLDGKEVIIPAVGVGGRGYLNSTIRIEDMAAGNEDPCDPSAREITTPTDKRNGDHC